MVLIHVDNLFQSIFSWRHIFRLKETFSTFGRDLRKTENVTLSHDEVSASVETFAFEAGTLPNRIFSFQNPWNMISILEWMEVSNCEMERKVNQTDVIMSHNCLINMCSRVFVLQGEKWERERDSDDPAFTLLLLVHLIITTTKTKKN